MAVGNAVLRRSSFAFSTGCEMLRTHRCAKAVRRVLMATRRENSLPGVAARHAKRQAGRRSWWKPLTTAGGAGRVGGTRLFRVSWARPCGEIRRPALGRTGADLRRPLGFVCGAGISAAQLKANCDSPATAEVTKVSGPAQWAQSGERFAIHIRDFTFWDGREAGQSVLVDIRGGSVARIPWRTRWCRDRPAAPRTGIGRQYLSGTQRDRVLVAGTCPTIWSTACWRSRTGAFRAQRVDLRGIACALLANLQAGKAVRAAAHLANSWSKFHPDLERSLWRKGNEGADGLMVDARYSKDEILEAYANEIFLGQEGGRAIHGFGLGAYFYFNRPVSELRLHEAALLVGLVKGHRSATPATSATRAGKP